MVASTLYQYLKYYRDREKKINGDVKPFTKAKPYFANARFFDEDAPLKEIMPSAISSIGKKRRDEGTHGKTNSGLSGNIK